MGGVGVGDPTNKGSRISRPKSGRIKIVPESSQERLRRSLARWVAKDPLTRAGGPSELVYGACRSRWRGRRRFCSVRKPASVFRAGPAREIENVAKGSQCQPSEAERGGARLLRV